MENGEIVKEYMLLKTFQDKAMKCKTRKDMILFCESFLKKHKIENPMLLERFGEYLSTATVSNRYGSYRVDLEMLTAGHRGPTYEMIQNNPNLQAEADIRAHTELVQYLARSLVEKGYVQIDKEIDNASMTYNYRARLIVGKGSKYT